MKENALVAGMLSGLVSGILVALLGAFTISASIDTQDIALPDMGGSNDEQLFVAPFSGEAILIAEFESTGEYLWGSIAVVPESVGSRYELPHIPTGRNFNRDKVARFAYPRLDRSIEPFSAPHSKKEPLSAADVKSDKNILCHQVDVGMKTDDNTRPARINLNCPLMKLTKGKEYLIKTYISDKGGSVDRFDAAIRYIYRRPRIL